MAQETSLEERVKVLEKEVAELKQRLLQLSWRGTWLEKVSGSMKDYPEFEEVLRLGAEIRAADRPPEDA
jgi:hypothetical protein